MRLLNGLEIKPPKYYDSLYELDDSERYAILKDERREKALNNPNNSWKRLRVREQLKNLKLRQLRRSYEKASI